MKKTIQIPEGFKIESFDYHTGELTLVPKALLGKITTFQEVCKETGTDPSAFITTSSKPIDIFLNQVKRIGLLSQAFNEGLILDAANIEQEKWFPVFEHHQSGFQFAGSGCATAFTGSILGPLLAFKDEETSNYVGKTFLEEYKKIYFPLPL